MLYEDKFICVVRMPTGVLANSPINQIPQFHSPFFSMLDQILEPGSKYNGWKIIAGNHPTPSRGRVSMEAFLSGLRLSCLWKARAIEGHRVCFLGSFGQSRDDFKKIADYPYMSYLKDGRAWVFVDCDDPLGVPHAAQMLNGP
jgi:hypothetical protein